MWPSRLHKKSYVTPQSIISPFKLTVQAVECGQAISQEVICHAAIHHLSFQADSAGSRMWTSRLHKKSLSHRNTPFLRSSLQRRQPNVAKLIAQEAVCHATIHHFSFRPSSWLHFVQIWKCNIILVKMSGGSNHGYKNRSKPPRSTREPVNRPVH
ncbi:hypothetical protein Adt_15804 [Abeliophyllum distichum]|uniref:Uncharacterized protein n=1 Tax=Abeliophyllum distichum TaxID=126358 RepID=A0ABD1U3J0_9LAMI